jgi:ArsR family transcriptional regulator, arsenate/arsenite/antimonite-responsive transcriptional repressor
MDTAQTINALRALAHGHRLAAYRALVQAGREGLAVGQLRDALDLPAATLTSHLNQLRAAGLVTDEREGRVIRVRADYDHMNALLGFLTENCCGGRSCSSQSQRSQSHDDHSSAYDPKESMALNPSL